MTGRVRRAGERHKKCCVYIVSDTRKCCVLSSAHDVDLLAMVVDLLAITCRDDGVVQHLVPQRRLRSPAARAPTVTHPRAHSFGFVLYLTSIYFLYLSIRHFFNKKKLCTQIRICPHTHAHTRVD